MSNVLTQTRDGHVSITLDDETLCLPETMLAELFGIAVDPVPEGMLSRTMYPDTGSSFGFIQRGAEVEQVQAPPILNAEEILGRFRELKSKLAIPEEGDNHAPG